MRHRGERRSRRGPVAAVLVLAFGAVLALASGGPSEHEPRPERAQVAAELVGVPAVRPTKRARPEYLTRSYRAPPALVRPGAGGTLRIPSLGIRAPVDAVGLDGTAMAIPDDPTRVGWLDTTAGDRDLIGSSVLAGHVSDEHDRPGALARLHLVEPGAAVLWTDARGHLRRYRVLRWQVFARSGGLPATLFEAQGPHHLQLITCADRVTTGTGGFHYRSNLVVTAGEVTHQTRRGATG